MRIGLRHDEPEEDRLEREAAMAEFVALRAEILAILARRQNLLALQVTTSGALFSFALSASGRARILLVVPMSSYLFCAFYFMSRNAVNTIARYFREDLSTRVPGLHWEQWLTTQDRSTSVASRVHPAFVAFTGVALLALLRSGVEIVASWNTYSPSNQVWWSLAWCVSFAATVACAAITWIYRRRRPARVEIDK